MINNGQKIYKRVTPTTLMLIRWYHSFSAFSVVTSGLRQMRNMHFTDDKEGKKSCLLKWMT